ncbi:MAG: 30S ribosomal protein S5 [Nanoarchaeota archaeon]|nr:30S ribosomal protein S5 [Nanoarchaeota archaeon]
MAEKISRKEQIKKESVETPVADAAEKIIEQNIESGEKELEEELEKKLEGKERIKKEREEPREEFIPWTPKTKLGKEVREGKIKNIDEILDKKTKILEDKIVDSLVNMKSDLLSVGQAKGKFGGGKRRAWRQTQKKTMEGNIPSFSAFAVVGDENGHVGVGDGKATETLPARDKAVRKAKLNIIKIRRACGSFDCSCSEPHSIPFKVEGKAGSVRVILLPAPQGTGLVAADELKKVLMLAGIKDIYSQTFGVQRTTFNLVKACMNALEKTNRK